jgi:hypothetical protein
MPRAPGRSRSVRTGDTAGGASRSARSHEPCRAPRRPHARSWNTWGRSGRATVVRRTRVGRPRSRRVHDAAPASSRAWTSRSRCARPLVDRGEHRSNRPFEVGERVFACVRAGAHQIQPGVHVGRRQQCTQPPSQSIALHRGTDGAADGERHLGRYQIGIENVRTPQRIGPHAGPVTLDADEGVALPDPVDQADRRARPLARRDLSTARPARVLIRARNPCLRARRRLLG